MEEFSDCHVRLPEVACVEEVRRGVTKAAAKVLGMARRARLLERVGGEHKTAIRSAWAFGSGAFLTLFPWSRPTGSGAVRHGDAGSPFREDGGAAEPRAHGGYRGEQQVYSNAERGGQGG